MTVRVLNINKGQNPKIEQKSKSLAGYSAFVAKVREFQSCGDSLKKSIEKAVLHCMDKGILQDYLRKHSSEVVNMLFTEFKLEDARAVWEKEAKARGIKEGEARGMAKARNELFSLWEKGVSLAEAKRKMGVKGQAN